MVDSLLDVAAFLLVPFLALVAVAVVVWALSAQGRAAIREKWTGVNRYERAAEELLEKAPRRTFSSSVIETARRQFSEADQPAALDLLSRYGADSTPRGRERVQLAILKLSGGSIEELRQNVKLALLDYRDVLYNAENLVETPDAPATEPERPSEDPPEAGARKEYDEDQVLTDYVCRHGNRHFTRLESLGFKAVHARFKAEHADPHRAETILEHWGAENDPRVTAALADGVEPFRRAVRDRVLRDHPRIVKRCPKCGKVLRTPDAKQCRWCFHDWH